MDAARAMQEETTSDDTMRVAVRLAVDAVPGCDAAGITIVTRGRRFETPAYTEEMVLSGDVLQYELGEGPCLDAIWEERVVHCPDLEQETRWQAWAPRVRQHGARSMMCFRLFTRSDTVGALNLYSRTAGAFTPVDVDEGLALAAHVAIAISGAQQAEQMADALDTRTVIGQATGLLMERFDLDATHAFSVLTRISSHSNTRVRDIATELVHTRHLPDESRPDHPDDGV